MAGRRAVRIGLGAAAAIVAAGGIAVGVGLAMRAAPAAPVASGAPSAVGPTSAATPSLVAPAELRCPARTAGDTDGDGRADVLIGAPGAAAGAGRVTLFAGSGNGLVARSSFALGVGAMPEVADDAPRFGQSLAMGDVNGDGCADAVVVDAAGSASGGTDIGGLTVLLGAPRTGPTTGTAVRLDAGGIALGESPLEDGGDRVTRRIGGLVLGDFDGDGFDDAAFELVVTADGPGVSNSLVHVVPGGEDGLQPARASRLAVQILPTGLGAPPLYGVRLAAADVDGDGADDLAVTAGTRTDLLLGARTGLDTGDAQQLVETVAPDVVDETLISALGDLDGDGRADLVVASPTTTRALVYPGTVDGLDDTDPRVVAPGTDGVPGSQGQAGFGRSLATGDLDGDGADELVIGGAGAVWVLPGGPAGASGDGALLLTPATLRSGVRAGDFGAALRTGAFGGGVADGLLVTDAEGAGRAGSVTVVLGGPSGVQSTGAVVLSEATRGVPGEPRRGDGFGVLPR